MCPWDTELGTNPSDSSFNDSFGPESNSCLTLFPGCYSIPHESSLAPPPLIFQIHVDVAESLQPADSQYARTCLHTRIQAQLSPSPPWIIRQLILPWSRSNTLKPYYFGIKGGWRACVPTPSQGNVLKFQRIQIFSNWWLCNST